MESEKVNVKVWVAPLPEAGVTATGDGTGSGTVQEPVCRQPVEPMRFAAWAKTVLLPVKAA